MGTTSKYDIMRSTPGSYCLQKQQYWQAMPAEISLLTLAPIGWSALESVLSS
jgi:hypothetical protein